MTTDAKSRCSWVGDDQLYIDYHDTEWGVPVYDDRALFEKLILDGFQAGLAWITILRKRENFIAAFDGFQPELIAAYGPDKVAALMRRHRAQPGQDRGHHRLGQDLARADGAGRRLLGLPLGLRGRPANGQPLVRDEPGPV
jgi:hypothetical protein